MVNINRHKFFLVQILKAVYSDIVLSNCLGFKGGTAMMFFYDLPRMSIDLDFNLIIPGKEEIVFEKLRQIILKYGSIHDEAMKFFGPVIVLDYGVGERKLKVEVSNRQFNDRYEIRDLMGISVRVMVTPDMFAHKLCALLDRENLATRDIFDCWYFMHKQSPVNKEIIELRTNLPLHEYLGKCIDYLENMSEKGLLHGIGELMNEEMKKFVRTKLRTETIFLMKFYQQYPILQ